MSTKKFVPMLLAASVLMTGFSGAFIYSPQAAFGITSVDELSDVDQNSWAFDALRDLVEKYNVIEGYPDKTFRGDHKASRYEMAAALNALIRHIGKDIARLGAEKADKEDLAKLAKLQEEFKAELAALQARTAALEDRAAKIEAKNEEQDNRLSVLEKLKIYGDVVFGGYADIGGRGGDGTPLPIQGQYYYGPGAFPNPTGFTGGRFGTAFNPFNGQALGRVNNTEGLSDSISALGRVRINVDYPIVEDTDGEGIVGPGKIHTRLVAAFGRVSPMLSQRDAGKVGTGSGLLSGVSKIAGDSSLFNEGVRTSSLQPTLGFNTGLNTNVLSGTDTRANVYMDSAYYTQEFRSGIPILTDLLPGIDLLPDDDNWRTSMKMHMGLIPWREIFQKSPYTGNEVQQFQNTSLVNNAAIPVNVNAPMIAFDWHQGLGKWTSLDLRTGISAIDVSDAFGALGITYEGSLNYNFGWLADWMDHPGNIYAGGFVLKNRGGSNGMLTNITGITGRNMLNTEDMLRGLASNPANMFTNAYGLTGAVGSPTARVTNNVLRDVAFNMGLANGNALLSSANLAAVLGITPAALTNPNTVLPNQTILNINATGVIPAMPVGTTLGAYLNQIVAQGIAAAPVPAGGMGLAGAAPIWPGPVGLPSGDDGSGAFDDNDNVVGFYAGVNQEIYRGAGLFFSYGVCDTGPMSMLTSALQNGTGRNIAAQGGSGAMGWSLANLYGVKESINGGIEVPMKALHLPWREKDILGVGYAMLKPNDAYGSAYAGTRAGWGSVYSRQYYNPIIATPDANFNVVYPQTIVNAGSTSEHIIETYYKIHVNDRFSITPNVQFIIHRLGDPQNDLTTVLGLRSSFTF